MDTSSNQNVNTTAAAVLGQEQSANSIADCSRRDEQFPWICSQQEEYCSDAHYQPCQNRIDETKASSTGWRPVLNALDIPYNIALTKLLGSIAKFSSLSTSLSSSSSSMRLDS
jgi:hypothetical protein